MADIILSTTYAATGSGPKASCIGWIDWNSFSLAPNITNSVIVNLTNGFTLTFDVANQPISGEDITFLSDVTIPNSAFGSVGYTGITENIALEAFSSYLPTIYDSAKLSFSNITVKDTLNNPISGYSIIIASIQLDSSPYPIYSTQTLYTNGSDWNEIAWLGTTSSPVLNDSNKKNIILTTSSTVSGSPVYSTNAPTDISVTIYSDTSLPQFAIGIATSSITLNKVINGRISTLDQFTLSITGPESGNIDTDGNLNGLQSKSVTINGPVNNLYTINEAMASGSASTLANYTQLVTWVNNCADGTPPPSTGSLGQSVLVDVGDNFVATISNTPFMAIIPAAPDSGPLADKIDWLQWNYFVLEQNSSSFVQVPIPTRSIQQTYSSFADVPMPSGSTLAFTLSNNSNAIVTAVPIADSAFGTDIYTGLVGPCCLEVTCYTPNVTLVLNNFKIIDPTNNIYYKYSIILSSIQYDANTPENYAVTQEFITNGSPWQELAWGGPPVSPNISYHNFARNVVITTTHEFSGSPVFISDPPTTVTINFSGSIDGVGYYISRFEISTTVTEIPLPSRGINLFKDDNID